MIALLQGRIVSACPARPGGFVIAAGGVGYDVTCSRRTEAALLELRANWCESVTLLAHTIVSETAIRIFGFLEPEEKQLFTELLKVDKVGPSTAIAVLGAGDPSEVRGWLVGGNTAKIAAVKGVGKKTIAALVAAFAANAGGAFDLGLELEAP